MQQSRLNRKKPRNPSSFKLAEMLEIRCLLSAIPDPIAYPVTADPPGNTIQAGQSSPPGYSPAQIKAAYGINNISFNGTAGTGAGQTIAIVSAYDNPNFVDTSNSNFSNSDLHKFDVALGLPDPPSFTKVDENGGTNYPPSDYGWANEIALDVEWTHAIAPQANILLVECSSSTLFALINGGVQTARETPGVSVVTMSFAVPEFLGETQYDQYLTTPAGHAGITFVAASGDAGDPGGYPAFSPNVVAVGATTLTLSGSSYGSEVGHNTSGGGISQYESKPTYQYTLTKSSTFRTTPDVSIDGDPNTGVSVYDSYNGGGSTPWYKIGGTSFSSPAWGGLVAIADQGRATLGLSPLNGSTQTLPRLYELPSSDFHDITSGNSDGATGATSGTGYDLVTGIGSPIANSLIPDLAGGNTVSGTIFNDQNGDGTQSAGDAGLSGFATFVDLYHNDQIVGSDTSVTSGTDGTYQFADLPGGTYRFNQITPAGWNLTTSSSNYTLTLGFGSTLTGKNIGYKSNGQSAKLVFIQQPSAVIVTNDITPAITVEIENANGQLETNDGSAITLSVLTGTGPLSGEVTRNAFNGIATFDSISLNTADTDTLQATDGNLAPATSSSFVVSNMPADVSTQLVFGQQPTNAAIGTPVNPPISVYLEDASGHIVSTDTSAVTLALAPGSTTNAPTGTLTVNAVDGIAQFSNVIFTSAGTATITATDGLLTAAVSRSFTTSIVPVKLVFAQQPTATNIGSLISPPVVVDVGDYLGNPVATDNSAVTLSITGGVAALAGTVTVNAVGGVATFSNLTVPSAGTYTLNATDASLFGATSGSFNITVPGTVVPVVARNTLAGNLVAGSKLRGLVSVNETATATATGQVTTEILAVASDGTSTTIGQVTKTAALRAGKKYPVAVPILQLPSGLDGTYSIKAEVIDSAGDSNTTGVLSNISVAAAHINLTGAFTKLTLTGAVVAGSKTRTVATVKITNSGNVASPGLTTVGIYASPDGLMADAVRIALVSRKISVRANGGTALLTVPLGVIPGALNGSYTILAEITDPNQTVTTASSNSTVTIAPAFVALSAAVGAPAPASVAPGKPISFTVTIHNAGNTNSTGIATISYGLSADGATALPDATTLMKNILIPNGRTLTLRLRYVVPAATATGMYFPFLSFTQGTASVQIAGQSPVSVT